ncbi:unnamed protein product, partial [Closterium sp. Naga37s-1]
MAAALAAPCALPEPSPADMCALRRQLASSETAAALLARVRARGEARGGARTGFSVVDEHRGVAEGGSGGVTEVVGGSGSGKTEVLMRLAAAHLLPLPPRPAHPPAAAGRGGGGSSGWEAAGGGGAVVAYMDLDVRFPMPRFMHVLHARAMQCVLDAHEGSPLQACEQQQQQQQQRVEGLVQAALRRFHLLPCRNTCHWLACLKSVSSLLPVWRAQQHEHRPGVGNSSAGVNAGVGAGATDGHAGEQAERMESVGAGEACGLQGEQRGGAGEVAMQHGGAEVAQWSWFSPAASAGQQSMS